MPVIYGRRRIGKSALIRRFSEGKKAIIFTAVESSAERNLDLFSRSIYSVLMPFTKNLPAFSSFTDAFDFLTEYVRKERYIVVIDEYPYLAEADKGISSLLQSYIDGVWRESRMYLILCGSSMSFMENQVLGYQSPLYGRRTAQLKLRPLDYVTAARFVPDYSEEDKALVYGVTGGVPKYLELFRPELSLYENLVSLFFSSTGYLYEEPGNLLKQELREIASYNAVMEALAGGASKVNEIVTKTHSDTASVSYCLKTLISLGIVEKCTAMTEENNKKKTAYHICDHMFRFWYRFVPDGAELIQLHQGELYFKESVQGQLNDYMGSVFEDMCRSYLIRISAEGKLDFTITKIGRWWGTNPKLKKEEEIDIVGVNPTKKQMLLGECKYRKQGIHLESAQKLMERGALITAYPNPSYVLCSLDHFSEDVVRFSEENHIRLVTLKDLYLSESGRPAPQA
jgi:AAA+ ATPase superfamily predicted ATPase